jgi:SurA N-terminal domain
VTRVLPRRIAGAALGGFAALAMLALTACEPNQPGAAAIVGDQRISETELQESVRAIVDIKKETGQQTGDIAALTREELAERIESILVGRAAATEGLTVSEGEVSDYISAARSDFGDEARFRVALANSNVAPDDLERYTEFFLLREKLANRLGGANDPSVAQKYNQLILGIGNEAGVQISPRYGSWNPAEGIGQPKDDLSRSGSAEPAPSAPAPAPQ